MRKRFIYLCGLVVATFCLSHRSYGALLVYDGFNYTVGDSLTNSSAFSAGDSFGWGGRWANATLATNFSASLGYADVNGNVLSTDGGKVIISSLGGTTANAQPSRSFNLGALNAASTQYAGVSNAPGTYWASYLMQWVGPPTSGSTTNQYGRKGDLVFRASALISANSTGNALHTLGSPNAGNRIGVPFDTWSTWAGNDASAGTFNTGFAVATNPLTAVTFVLVRFDLDGIGGVDNVYTWFNWTNLTVEPPISLASTTDSSVNEDGINNIRLDANGGNATGTNAVLAFDEFRLGNTFADVTPLASTPQPPNITAQPANQTDTDGTSATFSVTAIGDPVLHYQWYFNTNVAVGIDTNILFLPVVHTNDGGPYIVVVSNLVGSVTSFVATLTIAPPMPPAIANQPASQIGIIGDSVTFTATATGSAPLQYQWYYNTNTALTGQTIAALTLPSVTTNDAGTYSVIVTNLYGAATSTFAVFSVIPPYERLPAFPGADGAGRYTTGGRGGIVYHVTKLDINVTNDAPGTLRYGLTDGNFPAGTPRTIVFDVAGTFWLGIHGAERPEFDNGWDTQARYNVGNNVTIAGQTAPGPVIIQGGTLHCNGNNIIVRNITIAAGYGMKTFNEPDAVPPRVPTIGDFPDTFAYDAVDIQGVNTILDHLTTLYCTDEAISCNEVCANLTFQYCDIALGQNYPQNDAENPGVYEGHDLGSLLQAGSNAKISVVHDLYAHERGRLPRVGSEVGTGPLNDFRNDVFYNWFSTAGTGASGQNSFNNFINNYYLAGPGGDDVNNTNITTGNPGGIGIFSGISAPVTRVYASGNLKDLDKDGNPIDGAISADSSYTTVTTLSSALDVNIGATLNATASFTNVMRYVGSRWWARPYDFTLNNTNAINTNDIAVYLDERIIKETVTGTGKITAWADDPFNNDPNEGWEWRRLLSLRADTNTFAAPFNRPANWDTDGDGMPDTWEIEHGLDPNVANPNGDFDHDGYTDLEEYLNEIAAWPAPGVINFNNTTNSRYAEIYNWSVSGATVNIAGSNVVTLTKWQPSGYDTALISNKTCIVDSVGQHAGTLLLQTNSVLNITNGWLDVSGKLDIGAGCTVAVQYTGSLHVTNSILNNGTLRLTGSTSLLVGSITNNGLLDIMTWNGTLPPGFVNNGVVLDHSLVKVLSAVTSGNDFVITIQGYTGHNYQLQYRDDAAGGVWQNVGASIPGNDAPIQLPHVGGAGAAKRFYQVAVSP